MNQNIDWAMYIAQMAQLLEIDLDEARRAALLTQMTRIAGMAIPLMALPLDDRLEVAGVYKA
ncbi:MAG: oxalurate catabolism protein HpxX [Enterobacterales bacterium endosymbiont of Blomia tropicalis]|uniref:oxalurate catabolism protein HpxX n=1 Tax=Mixta mediterraneensis TaxID=2758443 RepID=UPI001876F22A|nr:oxalurate catabolism protein HpxX [Mixta mediterraneensis]MBE5251164.1 oxalurate catabolism protein HpxX [Mixta mediterraneensis]MDL4914843.1 oxalurate catabolism protein HpxX [Mixta mediterraneensis]